MKKNGSGKRVLEPQLQPDKTGWVRKFCGKGLFREIWKNRFVILKQDQLYICHKEVKEPGRADEVLDLLDFDRCEEIRKNRSRSKKSHSKFRLVRSTNPGNKAVTLVFLAVSPEEKESWIHVLNIALSRAKNRVLDQVTVEDSQLAHLTRDRVRIPHTRRLPTRGHLLAVASTSSDGGLTLDLIHEEDSAPTQPETQRKPHTLPRQVAPSNKTVSSEKSVSLDQIPRDSDSGPKSESESESISRLQQLIQNQIQRTETLLTELSQQGPDRGLNQDQRSNVDQDINPDSTQEHGLNQNKAVNQDFNQNHGLDQDLVQSSELNPDTGLNRTKPGPAQDSGLDEVRAEACRLLTEARDQWNQAHEVLTQVQELKELYVRMESKVHGNTDRNTEGNTDGSTNRNADGNTDGNSEPEANPS